MGAVSGYRRLGEGSHGWYSVYTLLTSILRPGRGSLAIVVVLRFGVLNTVVMPTTYNLSGLHSPYTAAIQSQLHSTRGNLKLSLALFRASAVCLPFSRILCGKKHVNAGHAPHSATLHSTSVTRFPFHQ